jgi:hypothetical protein
MIQGTNFRSIAGENTVKFNAVTASLSAAIPSQLIVVVFQRATSGKITITIKGSDCSSPMGFIVLPSL